MGKGALELNTTTNIYVVHTYNKTTQESNYRYHGVYSSKELADAAGKEYCETWGEDTLCHTVNISALDDMINGVHRSEL